MTGLKIELTYTPDLEPYEPKKTFHFNFLLWEVHLMRDFLMQAHIHKTLPTPLKELGQMLDEALKIWPIGGEQKSEDNNKRAR